MIIKISYDAAAQAAPQSFRDGIQGAANMLDAHIVDNITVNISVAYGSGDPKGNQNISFGSPVTASINYSDLRTQLLNHETSANDTTSVNNLATGSSIGGQSSFSIGTAQRKAFGLTSAHRYS
jgi:serralysin